MNFGKAIEELKQGNYVQSWLASQADRLTEDWNSVVPVEFSERE